MYSKLYTFHLSIIPHPSITRHSPPLPLIHLSLLAYPFSTIAFQPAVATTPDFVFIIDVADVVALLLVGIAVVYEVRTLFEVFSH